MASLRTPLPEMDADGVQKISVNDARGAQRVGLIWMLVVSTVLAVVLLIGFWAFNLSNLKASQDRVDARAAASAPQANAPSPTP